VSLPDRGEDALALGALRVQETEHEVRQAPSHGKPVLVLRDGTEWEEGLEAGACRLVGTDADRIVDEASGLLSSPSEYALMSRAVNPYGDGQAAQRVDALRGLVVDEWRPALAPAGDLVA
jgi:hypothetical protein